MIIKQSEFQAKCINNKYMDFGNHTGFQFVERTYNHLVIGEWYDFKRTEWGLDLYIDGKHNISTGHSFSIPEEGPTPECYNFYKFFSTVEAHRDKKLDQLGI